VQKKSFRVITFASHNHRLRARFCVAFPRNQCVLTPRPVEAAVLSLISSEAETGLTLDVFLSALQVTYFVL
jgi:hypothetical protein